MPDRFPFAFALSAGLHAAGLFGWSATATHPIALDVERGPASVEFQLVRAPASAQALPPLAAQPEGAPEPAPIRAEPSPSLPSPAVEPSGVITDIPPGYLRNPPPIYPRLGRQLGCEGTVLLEVEVRPDGRTGTITILASSGYDLLDVAAMEAVSQR